MARHRFADFEKKMEGAPGGHSRYGLTWSMISSLLKESANRFPCDNTLRRSLNLVIIDKRDGVADMGMPAWFDCFVKNLRLARYTPLVEVNQANKSLAVFVVVKKTFAWKLVLRACLTQLDSQNLTWVACVRLGTLDPLDPLDPLCNITQCWCSWK